ncbi:MAG: CYTH domain-containing protein [Gemmatimonadaceae bacterium]|nr:CYTH domain-containing protein [Gemmatimonadaceae bacterium]
MPRHVEIERKFLVAGPFQPLATRTERIVQGFLSSVPERTVRVRIRGSQGFLTIKGLGNASGVSRFEWEREIPLADAERLLQLCEPGVIEKERHLVPAGAHTFEVDEFHGENEGLVVAEIELSSEDEAFERPTWLGAEVTGDPRYFNAMLAKHPYTRWAKR